MLAQASHAQGDTDSQPPADSAPVAPDPAGNGSAAGAGSRPGSGTISAAEHGSQLAPGAGSTEAALAGAAPGAVKPDRGGAPSTGETSAPDPKPTPRASGVPALPAGAMGTAGPDPDPKPAPRARGVAALAAGAMGTVGRMWDFITDGAAAEAGAAAAATAAAHTPAPVARADMSVAIDIALEGARVPACACPALQQCAYLAAAHECRGVSYFAAGGCLECYEDEALAATWPASPRALAAVTSPSETPRRFAADLANSDRAAAHFSPRGSLMAPGAHPNAWDPVRRAATEARAAAAAALGSAQTPISEPSLRPAPASYLDQLEEAISPRHDPRAAPPLRQPPLSPAAAALAAAAAVAGGAPEAGAASPRAPAAGEAGSSLAALHWAGLEAALRIERERLSAVDVGLAACRITRQVGGAAAHAGAGAAKGGAAVGSAVHGGSGSADGYEAAQGLHQGAGLKVDRRSGVPEVLVLLPAAGVESAALTSAAGQPIALRVRWQPGPAGEQQQERAAGEAGPRAAAQPAAPAHLVSAHVGQLRAAHAPGFATRLAAFLGWPRGATPEQARGGKAAPAPAPSMPLVPAAPAAGAEELEQGSAGPGSGSGSGSALGWLSGRVSLGLSLLGVRLAVLADEGRAPEAALLAAERVSAHLGAMRPPARAGSLAAALWALPRWPAETGLRLSVRWPCEGARSLKLSSLLRNFAFALFSCALPLLRYSMRRLCMLSTEHAAIRFICCGDSRMHAGHYLGVILPNVVILMIEQQGRVCLYSLQAACLA